MISYKVVSRQKPGTSDPENLKYYATLVNPGKIDIEGLAKRISSTCTVTRADCLAVLSALEEQIVYALQSGMRVHLGDVGCFRLSCQSSGTATPEEFDIKQIKKLKVVFYPSKALRNAIALTNEEVQFYSMEGAATTEDQLTGLD